jgi:hypothetical protein
MTTPAAPSAVEDPRSILTLLRTINDGALAQELSEKMRDLVTLMSAQSQASGGKPKAVLTLKLNLKLDGGVFEIVPEIAIKEPKLTRDRTMLYGLPDGGLTSDNPRQYSLGLPPRDVSGASATTGVRSIGSAART